MKYKLSFTIDSEAMFGIMARLLPIEDMSVEELTPVPPQAAIRFDKRFDLPKSKAKPKAKPKFKRAGGSNLTLGVNGVIANLLLDQKIHTYGEIKDAIAKTIYSPAGIGSRLDRLVVLNYINRLGGGKYSLTDAAVEIYTAQSRKTEKAA